MCHEIATSKTSLRSAARLESAGSRALLRAENEPLNRDVITTALDGQHSSATALDTLLLLP
jgi:hypothetical protein